MSECFRLYLQGAFTGVCSTQHIPSYKNNIDKFKAKGIDSVICVAVNDPYALNGWAEKLQAKEAVSILFSFCLCSTVPCKLNFYIYWSDLYRPAYNFSKIKKHD